MVMGPAEGRGGGTGPEERNEAGEEAENIGVKGK